MKRECMYCKKHLGYADFGSPKETTHGLCDQCLETHYSDCREGTKNGYQSN